MNARESEEEKWTDAQMQATMKSVQDGISGVNQAATDHGVPKTTLKDRLSGHVTHGINPGPRPYLNKTEESELSQFVLQLGMEKHE